MLEAQMQTKHHHKELNLVEIDNHIKDNQIIKIKQTNNLKIVLNISKMIKIIKWDKL